MYVSESEYRPLLPYSETTSKILLNSLNPVDHRKWRIKSWRWRVLKILKVCIMVQSDPAEHQCHSVNDIAFILSTGQTPVEILLLLCIPVVDPDREDKNWKRPLNCIHLITAPVVCVFTFQSGECKCLSLYDKGSTIYCSSHYIIYVSLFPWYLDGNYMIQGEFPLWLLIFLLGLFLSAIVFCTTINDQPPKYHPVSICDG